MQIHLPSLDVHPSTQIIGRHLLLKEMGILDEEEEENMDLTKLNFH